MSKKILRQLFKSSVTDSYAQISSPHQRIDFFVDRDRFAIRRCTFEFLFAYLLNDLVLRFFLWTGSLPWINNLFSFHMKLRLINHSPGPCNRMPVRRLRNWQISRTQKVRFHHHPHHEEQHHPDQFICWAALPYLFHRFFELPAAWPWACSPLIDQMNLFPAILFFHAPRVFRLEWVTKIIRSKRKTNILCSL